MDLFMAIKATKPPKAKNYPIFEVFGYPFYDKSAAAIASRAGRLCPFQGADIKCTKVSVTDPLGVCSVSDGSGYAITCPTRFKEGWIIERDAAAFFFAPGSTFKRMPEVRIKTRSGEAAGNIDVVLAKVQAPPEGSPPGSKPVLEDFGSVEIQAVYISGNVRVPFNEYMSNPDKYESEGFTGNKSPRADYLSSSRKRLAPQLIMKGGILKSWNKKQAIVLHKGFYDTLPDLSPAKLKKNDPKAEVAWLVYDLIKHPTEDRMVLTLNTQETTYTDFATALGIITVGDSGDVADFEAVLRTKL